MPGKAESIAEGDDGSRPSSSGAYLAEGKMQLRAAEDADDPLPSVKTDAVRAVATLCLSLASSMSGRRHDAGFSLYSNVAIIIICVCLYASS